MTEAFAQAHVAFACSVRANLAQSFIDYFHAVAAAIPDQYEIVSSLIFSVLVERAETIRAAALACAT